MFSIDLLIVVWGNFVMVADNGPMFYSCWRVNYVEAGETYGLEESVYW